MPNFAPDQTAFQDQIGYSIWDVGHAREHIAIVQALAARTPQVSFPDWNFLSFMGAGAARNRIREDHYAVHDLLRTTLGVQSADFSHFDLDNEGDFYNFMQVHSQEHQLLRQALGLP